MDYRHVSPNPHMYGAEWSNPGCLHAREELYQLSYISSLRKIFQCCSQIHLREGCGAIFRGSVRIQRNHVHWWSIRKIKKWKLWIAQTLGGEEYPLGYPSQNSLVRTMREATLWRTAAMETCDLLVPYPPAASVVSEPSALTDSLTHCRPITSNGRSPRTLPCRQESPGGMSHLDGLMGISFSNSWWRLAGALWDLGLILIYFQAS